MAARHYAREFYDRWDKGACPVCNLTYVLPEDVAYHRSFHRRVLCAFEPQPNKYLARKFDRNGQFIPVRHFSSSYLRKRLANIARTFKREFGSDFTPYDEIGDDCYGFLIVDEDGRARGGFVVRWMDYQNASSRWVLNWIWIAPAYRRKGLLKATWDFVKGHFPSIEPDPPFSDKAANFFADRTDVPERVSERAKRQSAASKK